MIDCFTNYLPIQIIDWILRNQISALYSSIYVILVSSLCHCALHPAAFISRHIINKYMGTSSTGSHTCPRHNPILLCILTFSLVHCVLAPVLFNILFSAITRLFHQGMGHEDGVQVEYRLDGSLFNIRRLQAHTKTKLCQICELQYADDCAVLAHSPDSMQHALNTISSLYQSFSLQVNIQKTEVMSQLTTPTSTPPSFHINGIPLNTVDHFTYLGSTLSSCCSLDTELHTRINKASSSFGRLRSRVFENRNPKVSTKIAVYNTVCLSTLWGRVMDPIPPAHH